jgi:Helix-turn-helix of DDE superfamily endonuclease
MTRLGFHPEVINGGSLAQMVSVLQLNRQGRRGGQAKLSAEEQLLVALNLEYWREYRSQFHIGVSWGLHEITVGRIVRKVEDVLVKYGQFRLPSQRQLYQHGWEWTVS